MVVVRGGCGAVHRRRMATTRKWKQAAAVAERQHLVVAVWQLVLLGISEKAITERVRAHGWRRLSNGVVALPGNMTPIRRLAGALLAYGHPTGAAQRVEAVVERTGDVVQAVVAAAMGSGAVVCGRSAWWLHGISGPPEQHWIRLPAKSGHAARRGTQLRYGPFTGTLGAVQGLPVVDVVQAFKDVAGGGDVRGLPLHHALTRAIATADALRLATLDDIEGRLGTEARFVGAPALRAAVADLRGELSHSATERVARRIAADVVARHGQILHPRPYEISNGSRTIAEADLAIVDIKLDLEIDGPHHLLPAQRERDQVRDRRLRRAQWEVERFSTELVDLHPAKFAASVDECVRSRLGR